MLTEKPIANIEPIFTNDYVTIEFDKVLNREISVEITKNVKAKIGIGEVALDNGTTKFFDIFISAVCREIIEYD